MSSSHTHIDFTNTVTENDSVNPIDLEFLYNGGGVAVGDFNNDGLSDLYFTASTTSNKLYLNKGNLVFDDITDEANADGEGRWANAASVVDINNDGWKDIYVCATIKKNAEERKNLLYINQGLNNNKHPHFKEMAAEYGLADTSHSVHAAFFDYDNDSDLDMYLVTTKLAGRTAVQFSSNNIGDTSKADMDKLFRNDWNAQLNHPYFTEVSSEAGISENGFGLGIAIADINRDGWKDVYVTNDFFTSDHLYINNKNGTFTNKVKECFKHTSQNAMGNDIADINNDGLADVLAVDMNPENNYRKKKNMGSNNYYVYQNMLYGNYMLQYVRNTLQLNMGPRVNGNDSIGEPVFAEISFYAGIAETDWSWNASIADFDNDGNRDIIITNGYPRDVTDHDFAVFRFNSSPNTPKQALIDQIPQIKIPNYAFQNTGNLKFINVTKNWGMDQPSFSNGAAYADLDNDGDLDYVINNINEKAIVYENTTNNNQETRNNYLQVQFSGEKNNRNGLGAVVSIYYGRNNMQVYENFPYRGYLSTVGDAAHFGLAKYSTIDSLIVTWPQGQKQVINNIAANQRLTLDIKNASTSSDVHPILASGNIFTDITSAIGIDYKHTELDAIDFDKERLLPHKLSQYGPGLAVGDVDGNGLDDIVAGGNSIVQPTILLQKTNGSFIKKMIPNPEGKDIRKLENMGLLLFDADSDNDLDLYMTSGSNEHHPNTKNYQDRLFINDGKGNFQWNELALPQNYTSKSCVKAADFDKDGDLDLFVGGRVLPGSYPLPVNSFIYRNDSKQGTVKFTDITSNVAPALINIGLTCDALWTDFDNDGWTDLIVAGEWMPVKFLKNNNGKFADVSSSSGINAQKGWWNSIAGGDFDNDGDIDYIVGNLGENSFYRATDQYPVNIYAKDYDKNGAIDAITTVYLKDEKGNKKEFTAHNRDDINNQLPSLKKKFLTYKEFGSADFNKVYSEDERKDALHLSANYFKSSFVKNLGNGKFEIHPLPPLAQLAPVYGITIDDYNDDGYLDVALVGNDFGTEVSNGRYDALNGLVLIGDGSGKFQSQTIVKSGFFVPGDAKALVKLRGSNNNYMLAASQNNGPLKVFRLNVSTPIIPVNVSEEHATVFLKNGQKRREELYFGSSFLSQPARFLQWGKAVEKIEIRNSNNRTRLIEGKDVVAK